MNASFSRKPFKTSSYTRLAPSVPHNFGVCKKKAHNNDDDKYSENGTRVGSDSDEEIDVHNRTSVRRKIEDLKRGQIVRTEYSATEKEKFLAGNFVNSVPGNVSVVGDRIQLRKLTSSMRDWSKEIFAVLSQDWPHLRFKIMLGSIYGNNDSSSTPRTSRAGQQGDTSEVSSRW